MLPELVEYAYKMEEKVKVMKSKMKENVQGTNSEKKETGTQSNDLEQKEETHIQPEQNEETEFKKKLRRILGTSGITVNVPTSKSSRCQKEKRKSKKLKIYLKK